VLQNFVRTKKVFQRLKVYIIGLTGKPTDVEQNIDSDTSRGVENKAARQSYTMTTAE